MSGLWPGSHLPCNPGSNTCCVTLGQHLPSLSPTFLVCSMEAFTAPCSLPCLALAWCTHVRLCSWPRWCPLSPAQGTGEAARAVPTLGDRLWHPRVGTPWIDTSLWPERLHGECDPRRTPECWACAETWVLGLRLSLAASRPLSALQETAQELQGAKGGYCSDRGSSYSLGSV